jgi:hypothetical protein
MQIKRKEKNLRNYKAKEKLTFLVNKFFSFIMHTY